MKYNQALFLFVFVTTVFVLYKASSGSPIIEGGGICRV